MLLGINIFWALLRAHFNPRLTARAKMSLSQAQNIFMPANINSIVLFCEGALDMKWYITNEARSAELVMIIFAVSFAPMVEGATYFED